MRQKERAEAELEEEQRCEKERKDEMRQQRLHATRREHEYLQEWQNKGVNDWVSNQARKKDREERKRRVQTKLAQQRNQKVESSRNQQRNEMLDGIDAFEQTLKNFDGGKSSATSGLPLPPAPVSASGTGPETAEELYSRLERQVEEPERMEQVCASFF